MSQDYDKERPLCDDMREQIRTQIACLKAMYLKALNGDLPTQSDYREFCNRCHKITNCARL